MAKIKINKIAVYIPAYNAAATLPRVFSLLPNKLKAGAGLILVVDNASQDSTSRVARQLSQKHRIKNFLLIRNAKNAGYGGSQKLAYREVIRGKFDRVIMLHGDAQYSPGHALRLMNASAKGKYDLLFGSRIGGSPLRGGMPLHRYIGNRILTGIQNILLRTKMSEFHSGYRVYKTEALKKINLNSLSSDYHFDTEIMICMLHLKMRIGEIPIPTRYANEKNYVNIWKYGLAILRSTFSYYLHDRGIRHSKKWSKIFI